MPSNTTENSGGMKGIMVKTINRLYSSEQIMGPWKKINEEQNVLAEIIKFFNSNFMPKECLKG